MITIVSPTKAGYRLLFFDGRIVTAVGQVTLAETPKGIRPKEYRVRQAGRRQYPEHPDEGAREPAPRDRGDADRPHARVRVLPRRPPGAVEAARRLPALPARGPRDPGPREGRGEVRQRADLPALRPARAPARGRPLRADGEGRDGPPRRAPLPLPRRRPRPRDDPARDLAAKVDPLRPGRGPGGRRDAGARGAAPAAPVHRGRRGRTADAGPAAPRSRPASSSARTSSWSRPPRRARPSSARWPGSRTTSRGGDGCSSSSRSSRSRSRSTSALPSGTARSRRPRSRSGPRGSAWPRTAAAGSRDPRAALVVGTYEGVDHQIRLGRFPVEGRHGRDRRDPDARGPRAGPPARRADRAAQAPLPAGPVPLPLGHDRLAEAAREEARRDPGPVPEPARAARPPPGLRRAEGEDPHDQAARGRGVPARSRRRGSTARRSSSRTRAPAATRWPSSSGRRRGPTMPG